MLTRIILLLAGLLLVASCTPGPSYYYRWSAEPTPSAWKPQSVWQIVLYDKQGRTMRSMTVVFTERKAETCISGDWKILEIEGDTPEYYPESPNDAGSAAVRAYLIRGSVLEMELYANWCDTYYHMVGHIRGHKVVGTHGPLSLGGETTMGRFIGHPIGESKFK